MDPFPEKFSVNFNKKNFWTPKEKAWAEEQAEKNHLKIHCEAECSWRSLGLILNTTNEPGPFSCNYHSKKKFFIITKILNHHNHEAFRIQKKLCIDHQNKKASIIKICVRYTKKH